MSLCAVTEFPTTMTQLASWVIEIADGVIRELSPSTRELDPRATFAGRERGQEIDPEDELECAGRGQVPGISQGDLHEEEDHEETGAGEGDGAGP